MKRWLRCWIVLAAGALGAWPLGGAGAAEIDVEAPRVPGTAAPVLDGRAEAAWERARQVRFMLGEGSQGSVDVRLRALRTDTHLYLLVQWPDRTRSLNRAHQFGPEGWKPGRGREDRLNIAWEVGPVKGFAAQGCQILCHKTEGVMRTDGPGERINLWYWMAQRTDPVGVADNWVMGHEPAEIEEVKTARRPVAPGGGPFEANWDQAARRPAFTFRPGAAPGPVLLRKDAVPLPAGATFTPGDRLPREVLQPPAGPRAVIEARGAWASGRWTVELRRALTTAGPDDVQFSGPGPYYFGISIHDDGDRDDHAQMGRNVLRLHLR